MTALRAILHPSLVSSVLSCLFLCNGTPLRADHPVRENFDSFPTGNFTTLATALGTMTAENGHASVANNRCASLPNCMRLIGRGAGTTSTALLTLPAPLAVKKILSLTGER